MNAPQPEVIEADAELPPIVTEADWLADRPWPDVDPGRIDEIVDRRGAHCDFDLRAALEAWIRDGIVVFERVVDPRLIDALQGDVEYLRHHHEDFELFVELRGRQGTLADFSREDLDSDGLKFNSIQSISRAAAHLSTTRVAMQFLGAVFDDAPCALQSLTFYKGSQQPIHIDYPYVRCQSPLAHLAASWIALEDIHPDSGPLAYYPGSHRLDVSGFFDWGDGSILFEPGSTRQPIEFSEYLASRVREAGIAPKVFCPRKGDLLIWHGNLAHEGTAIRDESRTRKSYVTHYTSLRAYPPLHRRAGEPDDVAISNDNGGYVFEYPWLDNPRQLPSEALFPSGGA